MARTKTVEEIKNAFIKKAREEGVGIIYAGTWAKMPAEKMEAFMSALRKRAGNENDAPLPGEIVHGPYPRSL